jgi:hypothetical protein
MGHAGEVAEREFNVILIRGESVKVHIPGLRNERPTREGLYVISRCCDKGGQKVVFSRLPFVAQYGGSKFTGRKKYL